MVNHPQDFPISRLEPWTPPSATMAAVTRVLSCPCVSADLLFGAQSCLQGSPSCCTLGRPYLSNLFARGWQYLRSLTDCVRVQLLWSSLSIWSCALVLPSGDAYVVTCGIRTPMRSSVVVRDELVQFDCNCSLRSPVLGTLDLGLCYGANDRAKLALKQTATSFVLHTMQQETYNQFNTR